MGAVGSKAWHQEIPTGGVEVVRREQSLGGRARHEAGLTQHSQTPHTARPRAEGWGCRGPKAN